MSNDYQLMELFQEKIDEAYTLLDDAIHILYKMEDDERIDELEGFVRKAMNELEF